MPRRIACAGGGNVHPIVRSVVGPSAALLALVSVCAPRTAAAQNPASVLFGVVRDSAGIKLSLVEVLVLKTKLQAVTDDSGAYRIVGVPTGPLRVQFRRIGF